MNSSSWQKADPIQKKLMEEMCILVDEKDNITGADTKRNCNFILHDNSILNHK